MKRYSERVIKALNLDKEQFDNFLRLLTSNEEENLHVALNMMRWQVNATAKEMKAVFAQYVVMPIFESEKEIRERRISCIAYGNANNARMAHMKFKGWVSVQLYYIKKFVKCSPAGLNRATSIFATGLNNNVWARYEDFDIGIMNAFSLFSECANKLYGNRYDYW